MKLRVAAVLAAVTLPLCGAVTAHAAPVADGRTSCGSYDPALARVEQQQIDAAYAQARARQYYNDVLHDRDDTSVVHLNNAYQGWVGASNVYEQSKRDTLAARATAESACR